MEGGSGEGRDGRITEATVAEHRTIHSLSLSGSGPRILIASARSLQPERDQDDDFGRKGNKITRGWREGAWSKERCRGENRPSNVAYVSVGGEVSEGKTGRACNREDEGSMTQSC